MLEREEADVSQIAHHNLVRKREDFGNTTVDGMAGDFSLLDRGGWLLRIHS